MSERALLFEAAELVLSVPAGAGREAFVPAHLLPLPGGHVAFLGLTEVRGRAVPMLNLSSLVHPAAAQHPLPTLPALALLLEVQDTLLALPVVRVLGLATIQALPRTTGLLSEPYWAGDQQARHLNPVALLAAVHSRLSVI